MEHDTPPADDGSMLEQGLAYAFGGKAVPPAPSVLDQIAARLGSRPSVSLRDVDRVVAPPMLEPGTGSETRPRDTGKYKVLGLLGRGGVGVVHRGHDTDLGRDVAMKFLEEKHRDRPDVLYRFVEEAQIGGQLQHPGIVPVYELGIADGRPFFAMKMISGQTLARRLAERSSPAADRRTFLSIFESVCQTMAYAHARGVVHRDLKPANIMIGAFGEVQIVDWGMGKVLLQGGIADEKKAAARPSVLGAVATVRSSGQGSPSVEGSVIGTPAYMPPEQARGDVDAMDERSDVFGLGAILCEILTGHPPYTGDANRLIAMAAAADLDEAHTRLAASDAAPELVALANWCINREPAARPQSARVVARSISDILAAAEAEAHRARVEAAEARVRAAALKRTRKLGFSLAAVIALCLAAALWLWRAASESAANERQMYRLAERRASEAAIARDSARTHLAHFNQLSNVVRLETAQAKQERFYPAWPDQAEALRAWLDDDAKTLRDALPALRSTVSTLESRALPQTDAEHAEERRTHPRAEELANLIRERDVLQRARAVRSGHAQPPVVQVDESRLPEDAGEVNDMAWPLVDPTRTRFGREAEGLALARIGLARAANANERAVANDTLAWALFANGLDDEALQRSDAAVATATEIRRAKYEEFRDKLRAAIAAVSDPGTAAEIDELTARITELQAKVDERRHWAFTDTASQFLHDTLHDLVARIETFAAKVVPDVEQRLSWAERIEDLTITRYRDRWAQARQAIAAADGVRASHLYATTPIDLEPQLGLVPIGMDPASKLWEFYHLRSGWDPQTQPDPTLLEVPARGADGSLTVRDRGIVFVLIPGGRFSMGAQQSDPGAANYDPDAVPDEGPVREVELDPYFLSKYELTQGQWARLSGGEYPSWYRIGLRYAGMPAREPTPIGDDHPVEQVSWDMIHALLDRHGLRMPTEAQWECACRAGTSTPWSTGSTAASLEGFANVWDRTSANAFPASKGGEAFEDGFSGPSPVGTFRPNPFGLYDVHGNVWEWCLDEYGPSTTIPRPGDGLRQPPHPIGACTLRGGSAQYPARSVRSTHRNRIAPSTRGGLLGVRPARPLTR